MSYNMITGTLPLSDMAALHDITAALFDNNHFDAIDDPPSPFNGGFVNLKNLNFNYNRNMSGLFPSAIAYMPQLLLDYMSKYMIRTLPDRYRQTPWPFSVRIC